MFKRHHQLFTALRVVIDMLLVAAAFWGAYSLRFGSPRTWPYPELPLPRETAVMAALALVALAYFVREDRYSRGMLAVFTLLSFLGISLARVFFKELLQALRRRGYN